MNIVGAVFADFVTAPCGNPSQLRTELGGRTILAHTLRRLMHVEGLTRRCLFVRPRDRTVATHALDNAGFADRIELVPLDTAPRNRRTLLTAARKWNLESWRGGLLGSTWFDEYIDPQAAGMLLNYCKCDALFCLDGHQPVFDPALASAMLAHAQANEHESKLTFAQTPPGLSGVVVRREALTDVLEYNVPLGLLLSYRPELAQPDPINRSACFHPPSEVAQTAARLTGDTRRSRELIALALEELGEDATAAAALCAWLRTAEHDRAGPLPVEVELELTTADPLPRTTLRLRGARVPRREIGDLAAVAERAKELAEYDDRLVFLGGHGDPLQHPRFAEVCAALRSAGVYGIGVGTPLVDLAGDNLEALFGSKVDVVEVRIDANTAGTYQQVHGEDRFGQVVANVELLERTRRERRSPQPVIVCSLTRCGATIGELEGFYDHWIQKVGSAMITGYRNYCGELAADTLLPSMPTEREPCRRLATRLTLLADGGIALCDNDFRGAGCIGNWMRESLRDVWAGESLRMMREAHRQGELEALPACVRCTEWSRP
jgi:hypothetical protein